MGRPQHAGDGADARMEATARVQNHQEKGFHTVIDVHTLFLNALILTLLTKSGIVWGSNQGTDVLAGLPRIFLGMYPTSTESSLCACMDVMFGADSDDQSQTSDQP